MMLSKNEQDEIIREAVNWYGLQHQIDKCIEECAELIAELSRLQDGRTDDNKIVTELADVAVMVSELSSIYGEMVNKEIDRKLKRLKKRMKEEFDIKVSELAKPLPGWRINPNEKIVKAVIKGIERCNGECPCHNDSHDKRCPCSDYREKGICHCRLYVKETEL